MFHTEYQRLLWRSLRNTRIPGESDIHYIPPHIQELHRRVTSDPFDGGITARWMDQQKSRMIYLSIRDREYGHIIHVATDRTKKAILRDVLRGFHIMRWISTASLTWFWWDHSWKRILPRGQIPGKEHINGGWAIPGIPEIHVYRREEAHKVLIHEIIHAIHMDIPHSQIPPIIARFEKDLQRKLWPHLGEAYTEFYAEFLWCVYVASSVSDIERCWKYQKQCTEKQAIQVWARIHHHHEPEDTNVFAYYILKWVLMHHTAEVLSSPSASIIKWFDWWKEIEPVLSHQAKNEKISVHSDLPMGMTCGLENINGETY